MLTLPLVDHKEDHLCLPMAINVISKYWGEDGLLGKAQERAKKYDKEIGTIFMEGIELAEEFGFSIYIYKGNLRDLKKRIDQGIPPIVILPGINETIQHASVVIGYDSDEHRIITYVPQSETFGAIPEKQFLDYWAQDGFITLILLPNDMKNIIEKDIKSNQSYRSCFEADRLLNFHKNEEAKVLLNSVVTAYSENDLAWNMLGSLYNEENLVEAKTCFDHCLKLNPRFYLSLRGLGNYYLKNGNYDLADKYYSNAISVHSSRFGSIYKNRAIVRLQLDRKDEARLDLNTYLRQCPDAHDKKEIEMALREL
jgi:tetratricopeptide (TPR) repeat protein